MINGTLKRALSLLLVCAMMCAIFPARIFAQEGDIYISESFSDSATNSQPKGAKVEGSGSIVRVIEENKNKYLCIKSKWEDTSVSYSFSPRDNYLTLETRFLCTKNAGKKAVLQVRDAFDNAYDLVCLNANSITDALNNTLARYDGGWCKVKAVIDLSTMRCEMIVNGVKKASRVKIDEGFKEPKQISVTSYASGDTESEILYDYIYAYSGAKDVAFIDTKEFNEKTVKPATDEVSKPDTTPEIIMEENFDSLSVGSTSDQLTAVNGNQGVEDVTDRNGTQRAYAFHAKGETSPYANISFSAPTKKMVMQARIRAGKKMKDAKLFMIKDSLSTFCEFLMIKDSMQLTLYDGTPISSVSFKEKWHEVAVCVDFKKQSFDVYVDKVPAITGRGLMRSIIPDGIIRFQPATTVNTDQIDLYIDDIKLYSGTELHEFSKDENNAEIDENKQEYPYTVDDTKLDTRVDMLEELTTGKPDKVSAFLDYDMSTKSIFDNSISLVTGQSFIGIGGKRYKTEAPVIRKNNLLYAPVRTLGIIGGDEVGYDAATGSVTIGGKSFKTGDTSINNNGETVELGGEVINEKGVTYVPLRAYAGAIWHKYCGETANGLVVINSDKDTDVSGESFKRPAKNMINYLIYDRPSATELLRILTARYPSNKHKRTLATDEQLADMKWLAENTEIGKKWSAQIISAADAVCGGTITKRDKEGSAIGGYILSNTVTNLYWAYYITGDRKYLDCAVANAENMASFERWRSDGTDWLINSSIMLACATLYDLFYDDFSEQTKQTLAEAIINKGLNDAIDLYYGRGSTDWPIRESNWNIVCNTGVIVAATALMEDYPTVCSEAMEKALLSLEYEMDTFAPDGGGVEGMAYWHYIVQYMVLIFQTLENAYGTDFGVEAFPGIMQTGYFPIYCSGNPDYFSFGDADYGARIDSPEIMWFAKKNGDVNLQNARIQQCENYGYSGQFLGLLWYTASDDERVVLDKDAYYRNAEVASMRSSWDEFSTWAAFHAGYNSSVHGQFDIGDFEYELYGERMAGSMGRDNYNLPGYFNMRNKYYVHRTEGQNCYVINPDSSAGQEEQARAEIQKLYANDSSAAYMIDMSSAYSKNAKEAKRAFRLNNGRMVFTVQDEIVPKSQGDDVYWFWHTDGEVTLDKENSLVTIKKGWVKTTLHIDANVPFTMAYEDAAPMTSSPQPEGQLTGKSMKKLVFNFTADADKVIFRVTAVPMYMEYDPGELVEIDKWQPEEEQSAGEIAVSGILINGEQFADFKSGKAQYELPYDFSQGAPVITALCDSNVKTLRDPDNDNIYIVECSQKDNPKNVKYFGFTLKNKVEQGMPSGTVIMPVSYEAYAATTVDEGNLANNAFDGNLSTRWAAEGDGSWLLMDLGEVKDLNAFYYSCYLGDQRKQYFTVEVSNDGENFELVGDVTSSGTTSEYEYIKLNIQARYVRLTGYGNSAHKWNSFTEVGVCGK